jgi:enamine deaminase RidA (YjgF/YER057c/UK114 family)
VDGPLSESPHRTLNPETLSPPWGFSHAVVPAPGRTIYLSGQTAHAPDDSIVEDLVEQFDAAAANVILAMEAAGARPEHLVSMQIFVTNLEEYVARAKEIGAAYRRHFGKYYGATALIEVKGLVGGAKVELMCIAVVPEQPETK